MADHTHGLDAKSTQTRILTGWELQPVFLCSRAGAKQLDCLVMIVALDHGADLWYTVSSFVDPGPVPIVRVFNCQLWRYARCGATGIFCR